MGQPTDPRHPFPLIDITALPAADRGGANVFGLDCAERGMARALRLNTQACQYGSAALEAPYRVPDVCDFSFIEGWRVDVGPVIGVHC